MALDDDVPKMGISALAGARRVLDKLQGKGRKENGLAAAAILLE